MGVVRIACASGCACAPLDLDAHDASVEESLLAVAAVNVTQSAECTLRLEVLERTSSGEHKFKARPQERVADVSDGIGLCRIFRSLMYAARTTVTNLEPLLLLCRSCCLSTGGYWHLGRRQAAQQQPHPEKQNKNDAPAAKKNARDDDPARAGRCLRQLILRPRRVVLPSVPGVTALISCVAIVAALLRTFGCRRR